MRATRGGHCKTCEEPFRSIVARWLDLMAAHPARPGAKTRELHDHLRTAHGYALTASALQGHMQEHERARYEAAKIR